MRYGFFFFERAGESDVLSKALHREWYVFEDCRGFFDGCTTEDGYCENGCALEENREGIDGATVFLLVGVIERADEVLTGLVDDVAITRTMVSWLDSTDLFQRTLTSCLRRGSPRK